jgi:hypothetical protein
VEHRCEKRDRNFYPKIDTERIIKCLEKTGLCECKYEKWERIVQQR